MWVPQRAATSRAVTALWKQRPIKPFSEKEYPMDKDRIEGAMNQAKGALKEGLGKVTGDKKMEAEGTTEKAAGKVQNTVGGAKDAVRDATS